MLLRDLPPLATDPVTPSYGASTIGTTGRSPAAVTVLRGLLGMGFVGSLLLSWAMVAGTDGRYGAMLFVMFLGVCALIGAVALRPATSSAGR